MLLEAGVDWLTGTCAEVDDRKRLYDWTDSLLSSERELGNYAKPWRSMGYEGLSCGHLDIGERYDSAVVRLRSYLAAEHWRGVFPLLSNISRLDVQFTMRTDYDNSRALASVYKRATKRASGLHAKPIIGLRLGTNGAATLNIGSRQSSIFGRIYEKGVESGLEHYRNSLRFELELKKPVSGQVASAIFSESSTFGPCLAYVSGHYTKVLHWAGDILGLSEISLTCGQLKLLSQSQHVPRSAPDCQRELQWLRTQIRPTIERLIHHGYLTPALDALGLSESVVELTKE